MARSPFLWGQGGRKMTPDQVDRERLVAQALMAQASDTSPVGHWTAALNRALQGVTGGIRQRRAGRAEDEGLAAAAERVAPYLGGSPTVTASSMGGASPVAAALAGGEATPHPAPPGAAGHSAGDGHDHSDWLRYTNQGATRNQPISPELASAMSFLPELGLSMEVYSGGQPGIGEGGARVGSTRHDHGGAADVMFYDATGRMLDWNNPNDIATFQEIVRRAKAAGVTGIGAGDDYMGAGRVHIGFGAPGVWGAGGKGANAPEWLREAYGGAPAGTPGGITASTMGGSPVASALMSGPSSQELLGLLADPWVARQYGPVLQALAGNAASREQAIFAQQLAQSDPMYQAELARLTAPAASPTAEREAFALAGGLQPGSPEWGHYMLTGELPGGGEAFTLGEGQIRFGPNGEVIAEGPAAAPDSPTSVQEYLFYADQAAQAGQTPLPYDQWDMARKAAGAARTSVDVSTGGGKFEEAFAKGDAETIGAVYDAGLAATRNLGRIDQLEALLQEAPSGMGGRLAQIAGEWGLAIDGTDAVQAAQAMINSLVPEQRPPGSGPMSDADLELFKQSLPRIINTPGGNQMIVDTMRAIAQYDAQGAEIVQRLRSGEIDRATAFQMLQERQNPLAAFKGGQSVGGVAAPAPAAPAAGGGMTINGYTIRPVN